MKDKTVLVELKINDITLQGLKNVPRITIGSNLDRCKRVEQNFKNLK